MHGTLAAVILCAAIPSAGVQTTTTESRIASRIDAMSAADRDRVALVLASSPDPAALVALAPRPDADTDDDDCFIRQLEWLRCILSGEVDCGEEPDC